MLKLLIAIDNVFILLDLNHYFKLMVSDSDFKANKAYLITKMYVYNKEETIVTILFTSYRIHWIAFGNFEYPRQNCYERNE